MAPHISEPQDRERIGITVNADFAFMGSEEAEEDMQPSLVIYDDHASAFWALGVRNKTVTEQVVKYFKDILDESGYEGEKITMKTDQEPAMLALKRAVATARSGETVPIESPVRASKSNGRMENAIGVWQGQLRTIKHHAEAKLGRRIEVDGVLFSWLIPFCTQIMNKYRVGPDGRTAYERITGHKNRHQVIGFAEAVDFILEPSKQHIHKADSRLMKGIFLGYEWRTTEYIVGTAEGVFKCRTIRRRAEEVAYDPECMDYLSIPYDEYVLKGARTTPIGNSVKSNLPAAVGEIPVRRREFVPRRLYIRNADYERHGFTEGCKGCVWLQVGVGPRVGHSEACRNRLEQKIAEDPGDSRAQKAKDRIDHYVAQTTFPEERIEVEREDPREKEPDHDAQEIPKASEDIQMQAEQYDIGSPVRERRDPHEDELEDGPTGVSERRVATPVRPTPVKRRKAVHIDEPDTKKIIIDHESDEENAAMSTEDLSAINARMEDERIVCMAVLGKDLHDMFSNKRVSLAIERQSAEHLMSTLAAASGSTSSHALVNAAPEAGALLAGAIGGQEEPRADAAPQRGTRPGGVLGSSGLNSVDIAEIFSPERVGEQCHRYGLRQGIAMDIKNGYDFDKAEDRERCWKVIKRDKPLLVIGSAPCTLFYRLQELNKHMYRDSATWHAKFHERMQQARRYVKFCVDVYNLPAGRGALFPA